MNLTDPSHKKIIGLIYIIFSAFWLLLFLFFDQFMDLMFEFAMLDDPNFDEDMLWVFDIISSIFWGIAILFFVPRLVIGIVLLNKAKWAKIPALVYGVISLLNFPVGTVLGVYVILVFTAKKPEEDY